MSSKYDAAIDRGIALLDAKAPEWCKKMQLDHLDMANGDSCVLGQVFPTDAEELLQGFDVGCSELELREPYDYGFYLPNQRADEYDALTRRWKQRIKEHCRAH